MSMELRRERRGRRPGRSGTRSALLAAAGRRFSESGYDRTTIAAIAADVGVDPALVMHYFGSKDALFRAAVEWPYEPAQLAQEIATGPRLGAGERLARAFLGLWDAAETRGPLLAMFRSATSHHPSEALWREFLQKQVYDALASQLEGEDREMRAGLAAAHLVGIALLRHVIRVEPLASADAEKLVAWVAPALNRYLAPATGGEA
jgi:AcrR family transcriptional regulator